MVFNDTFWYVLCCNLPHSTVLWRRCAWIKGMHHVNMALKFTVCVFVPLNVGNYRCVSQNYLFCRCLKYYLIYNRKVSAKILTWACCSQQRPHHSRKRPTVPRTNGPLAHASPRPSKSLINDPKILGVTYMRGTNRVEVNCQQLADARSRL